MSESCLADEAGLRWLRWWCIDSWLQADVSWRQATFYQLDDARLTVLARTQHAMICRQLQLSSTAIPLDTDILHWLDLNAQQQKQALRLVAGVCWRDCTQVTLPVEQQRWCRRIAQAMRPGLWLVNTRGLPTNDADINGLWLLRLRAGAACWARLRLIFSAEQVRAVEQLPQDDCFPRRLLPVWQAVCWYASQEPSC